MKIFEVTQQIDVRGLQQAAKVKAYQDAIAAGKSEAEAQNAEAAAGNLAGADALSKIDINNPATYINNPGDQAGPSSEAERQEWMKDPTATGQAAKPAASGAKQWEPGVLGMGSTGPEVSALQKKLGIPADSNFGPATQQAVIALQQKLGVTPDGAYGPITKAAHDKMSASQATKPPATQPQYTQAQPELGTKKGATQAVPSVPVDPTAPSGVGTKYQMTGAEQDTAKDLLANPKNDQGEVSARDQAWLKQQLANQQAMGTTATAQQPATTPVAPTTAPPGQTAGGASLNYRTPRRNKTSESAELTAMLRIAGLR